MCIRDRVDSSSNWRLRATCGEALMKLNTSKVKDQLLETIKDTIPIVRAYALRAYLKSCLLYTSPSPRDRTRSRMPSSA